MQTVATGRKKDKHKVRKWILRIIALIIPILLLLFSLHQCGYLKFPWENEAPKLIVYGDLFPESGNTDEGNLPNMTPEAISEYMQKAVDEANLSFEINSAPVFKDGNSEGDLSIQNPRFNIYPIVVQITLNDTGEIIYDSGGILPNQHIYNAKLLKVLKAGTYEATATINCYHPETKVWQGKAEESLVITVQN